ncbi:hypothetical protein DBR42_15905 [Pelomonas sp. HMWF004]|nr:hypothetical protein DBR42_15905 [Pelomonas sp. HMWF004]
MMPHRRPSETMIRTLSKPGISLLLMITALSAAAQNVEHWTADSQGCKLVAHRAIAAGSTTWTGACPNGLAEGPGRVNLSVGGQVRVLYEGNLRSGQPSGPGRLSDPSGTGYEGEVLNGRFHGPGVLRSGVASLRGNFVDGVLDGPCVQIQPGSHRYDGECRSSRPEGVGRVQYANGDVYSGPIRFWLPHGEGHYLWAERSVSGGQSAFNGTFVDGKPSGHGIYQFAGGGAYEGTFDNGLPSGIGQLRTANEFSYDGPFEAGLPIKPELLKRNGTPVADRRFFEALRARIPAAFQSVAFMTPPRPYQKAGQVCSAMQPLAMPANTRMTAMARFFATALVIDGRVVHVDINSDTAPEDRPNRKAVMTSIRATMLDTYRCEGTVVIEHEFQVAPG